VRGRYLRRAVTIPVVALVTVVLTMASPVLAVAAALGDLATDLRRRRCSRLVVFVVLFGWIEVMAMVLALGAWTRAGGRMRKPSTQRRLQKLVGQHAHRIVTVCARVIGLRLVVTGLEALDDGEAVLCLSHHTSLLDSVLPAELLGYQLGYDVHYVMKRSLQWSPAMDIVGHWIPVHFVDRSGRDSDAEIRAVAGLARDLRRRQAPVIYPEGTFFNERRLALAVDQMAQRTPDLVARVAQLRFVLPPRVGGAFALLDAAPDVDVLLAVHVGFERFTSLRRIVASVPFRDPVHVHFWRVPRTQVPVAADERFRWLFAQFEHMDQWVGEQLDGRSRQVS
jgi:1-acyl-sn-glycerol-3-phosphate acyltransferase